MAKMSAVTRVFVRLGQLGLSGEVYELILGDN